MAWQAPHEVVAFVEEEHTIFGSRFKILPDV
jgi:hypothetical protein